jgi:zinc/manganese transport system substrate-binding protein
MSCSVDVVRKRGCWVMVKIIYVVLCCAMVGVASAAPIRIASLNPIVSDLARQVGGDDVDVIDLMPRGANPHQFYPSPSNLKDASRSVLVMAAGKGVETYLDEFREALGGTIPLLDVGASVPSLNLETCETFVCCPSHAIGRIDPHWWHSVRNAKRAAGAITERLVAIDPAHADAYRARSVAYAKELDELHAWARKRIARIPRSDRELATAHAAYGYFCREFGMRAITVQGLSSEEEPDPGYLKKVIKTLRDEQVIAVFPEENAPANLMRDMVNETGVRVGAGLLAGTLPKDNPSYIGLIRHNVDIIVSTLTQEQ